MWICLYNARSRGRDQSMCQTRVTADTLDSKKKKTTRLRIGKNPTYTILCHNLFFLMKITGFFCYLNGI